MPPLRILSFRAGGLPVGRVQSGPQPITITGNNNTININMFRPQDQFVNSPVGAYNPYTYNGMGFGQPVSAYNPSGYNGNYNNSYNQLPYYYGGASPWGQQQAMQNPFAMQNPYQRPVTMYDYMVARNGAPMFTRGPNGAFNFIQADPRMNGPQLQMMLNNVFPGRGFAL